MSDIVLSTLNAKYIHPAFGLRCLLANLGGLAGRAALAEFDIKTSPAAAAESILAREPRIVGLGFHIWNTRACAELAVILKQRRPGLVIVTGGPEIGAGNEVLFHPPAADYAIAGEADLAFADICRRILAGERPAGRDIPAPPPDLARLGLPYELYSADDLAHRLTYVETSRGCPYECEYCVSSGPAPLRQISLERILPELEKLIARGACQLKFVDRTFNTDIPRAVAILEFLLERLRPDLFLHFEMVPERFPPDLRRIAARFPAGSVQFEIGIQTLNPDVAHRIRRPVNPGRIADNLLFLRRETGVRIHADLIAGLPGESLPSFRDGFDRLAAWAPHEIQVGILKRLPGTPIARHDAEWAMVYHDDPPYEILENGLIDRRTMDRLKSFARFWELVVNRGRFPSAAPLIWNDTPSVFDSFLQWTDWALERFGRDHSLPLSALAEALADYLHRVRKMDRERASALVADDYRAGGRRRDTPARLARPSRPTASRGASRSRDGRRRGSAEPPWPTRTPGPSRPAASS